MNLITLKSTHSGCPRSGVVRHSSPGVCLAAWVHRPATLGFEGHSLAFPSLLHVATNLLNANANLSKQIIQATVWSDKFTLICCNPEMVRQWCLCGLVFVPQNPVTTSLTIKYSAWRFADETCWSLFFVFTIFSETRPRIFFMAAIIIIYNILYLQYIQHAIFSTVSNV